MSCPGRQSPVREEFIPSRKDFILAPRLLEPRLHSFNCFPAAFKGQTHLSGMAGYPRRGGKACGAQPAEAPIPPGWHPSNLNLFLRCLDPSTEKGLLIPDNDLPPGRFRSSPSPPRHNKSLTNFKRPVVFLQRWTQSRGIGHFTASPFSFRWLSSGISKEIGSGTGWHNSWRARMEDNFARGRGKCKSKA